MRPPVAVFVAAPSPNTRTRATWASASSPASESSSPAWSGAHHYRELEFATERARLLDRLADAAGPRIVGELGIDAQMIETETAELLNLGLAERLPITRHAEPKQR